MNIKRAVFLAVLVVAVAALAMPLVGLRAAAASSASSKSADSTAKATAAKASMATQQVEQQREATGETRGEEAPAGKISAATLKALGLTPVANPGEASARMGQKLLGNKKKSGSGEVSIQSGQPLVLNSRSALSAALLTTIGGRDNQFSEVTLIADWDGREDCAADREQKVDDFSFAEPEIDGSLTRTAISEHTVANGFAENVYYYGDSLGNVWVGVDTNPGVGIGPQVDRILQINLPTVLNAFGTIDGDDQVTVTGLAVSPVADLGSFSHVNGSFSPTFGPTTPGVPGVTGEILYVTYTDTEGGGRNVFNPTTGVSTIVRSGLLAFPISDAVSPASAPPGVISGLGFPVTVGGAFGVAFSVFSNVAGCAVDDDGSVYFQQVDLIQFTGANIVKVTSRDDVGWQDRSLATNGFLTLTTLNPAPPSFPSPAGTYGDATGPVGGGVSQVNRFTNYSGTSTLFGDIVAIATGGCNVLYAAVSRSFVAGDVSFEQLTEGLFPAPTAFGAAGTPSMIISFADCSGLFDTCTSPGFGLSGTLPVADGFADVAQSGLTRTPGVNNFRIFVQGNGPNLAPAAGGTAIVPGTPTGLLKVDMQIDYTAYSGLWVNQENTVFVISGGTPAGIGKNPSPMLGEVLCFEDRCPADRRADFVDLRGDTLPNPPASGGNVGDGDSDRFDHIFYQSPLDQLTLTPGGLAGLAGGFLRYTNRLAPDPLGPSVTLGQTGGQQMQGDDTTTDPDTVDLTNDTGTIQFENLDPGHQVAGGDDQNTPFRGDDNDGAGRPALTGALSGGFEFVFGGPVANCVWNGFFLNSNGNITFGNGDTSNTPTVPAFRTGPPRIAPAWTDLRPDSRAVTLGTFPVQALGFANINAFKVSWINVPQFGAEACTAVGRGLSNTFSVTLFDDGTGAVIPPTPPAVNGPTATSSDENNSRDFNAANPIGNNSVAFDWAEGPTDLRFTREPNTGVIVGCPPRPNGSGIFIFDFCRMDLLGTDVQPVITGFSIGGLSPLNPPGLCEINLSDAARAADTNAFGVIQGEIGAVNCACCIGEGTEPTIFELFNEGSGPKIGSGGEVTFARPDFDLRFEGNDAVLCTSARQRDLNRGRVCFFGVGCAPPANPSCQQVIATTTGSAQGTVVTTPTTTGIVNALCAVNLSLVGCGFFPNETTIICQGFQTETGIPLQRPGKTVTTAATLACDTNGDGVPEAVIVLTSVTPVNCNLIRATIPVSASFGANSTSGFPAACCGGPATILVTTTFTGPATGADNNVFGPFTRTTVCSLNLGVRAPVVISVTPSSGPCGVLQDVLITGACFTFTTPNPLAGQAGQPATIIGLVTSVFAVDVANAANKIQAQDFTVLNANLIDAHFAFGSANAGKTFVVFVTGTGGTSRGLIAAVAGQPAGCALGNEQGCLPCIEFTCSSLTGPCIPGTPGCNTPLDIAVVTSCKLDRQETGQFFLDVVGTNIKDGATATVGGVTPKKVKIIINGGTTGPTTLRLVKKVCGGLQPGGSGNVIVTNPGPNGGASAPFLCTERCPVQ